MEHSSQQHHLCMGVHRLLLSTVPLRKGPMVQYNLTPLLGSHKMDRWEIICHPLPWEASVIIQQAKVCQRNFNLFQWYLCQDLWMQVLILLPFLDPLMTWSPLLQPGLQIAIPDTCGSLATLSPIPTRLFPVGMCH